MNEVSFDIQGLRRAKDNDARYPHMEVEGPLLDILHEEDQDDVSYPYIPLTSEALTAEEVTIVIFVLLLWVGAIALFYHQWGKINGLEPYQPDFVHANLTIHGPPSPQSEANYAVQSQIVCSPGTAYDPSVSELGAVGSLSTVHHCLMKEKSESHYDFKVLPKNQHRNLSQSLEDPMTPSVVISFEADTAVLRAPQPNSEKARPTSLISLGGLSPTSSTANNSYGLSGRNQASLNKLTWYPQGGDSSCSMTSLHKSHELKSHKVNLSGGGVGGGLLLPVSRSKHGRSMNSLNRCGYHMSLVASSVSSQRDIGIHKRTMAAIHNRHLAASTLKLWQTKQQHFSSSAGGSHIERKKSLSATSLQCSKVDYV